MKIKILNLNIYNYNVWKGKDWNVRKLRRAKVEKGDIVINTSKHSIKQVVDKILKEVGEKRRKHPNVKALRKS